MKLLLSGLCLLAASGVVSAQTPMVQNYGTPLAVPGNYVDNCAPKVCTQIPSTKTVVHRFYSCKCEEFCLPSCGCLSLFCGSGCCGCDGPRVKYLLVKRVIKEECPTTKCIVTVAPCANGCAVPQGAYAAPQSIYTAPQGATMVQQRVATAPQSGGMAFLPSEAFMGTQPTGYTGPQTPGYAGRVTPQPANYGNTTGK